MNKPDYLASYTAHEQALQFEANHYSALARLQLERALQNQLLGHFLFW